MKLFLVLPIRKFNDLFDKMRFGLENNWKTILKQRRTVRKTVCSITICSKNEILIANRTHRMGTKYVIMTQTLSFSYFFIEPKDQLKI